MFQLSGFYCRVPCRYKECLQGFDRIIECKLLCLRGCRVLLGSVVRCGFRRVCTCFQDLQGFARGSLVDGYLFS